MSGMAISDHLRDLRALVGTRLLLIPSVSALIFDDADRLLMLRSSERETWMLPGGAVDPDEHPEAAVVRETFEETGLRVRVDSLHSVHGGPEFRVTYPNGDQGAIVMTCYRCSVVEGEMRLGEDEVAEARYVSEQEAAALPTLSWARVVLPAAFGSPAS